VPLDRTVWIDHLNAKHHHLTLIHLGCSGIALARNIVQVPTHLEGGVVLAHHSNGPITAPTHLEIRKTLGRPGSNMIVIDPTLAPIKALVYERDHHTITLGLIVTETVEIRSHCQLRVSTDKVTHLSPMIVIGLDLLQMPGLSRLQALVNHMHLMNHRRDADSSCQS